MQGVKEGVRVGPPGVIVGVAVGPVRSYMRIVSLTA
jgi:hypothetical protein